ncbi:hypothetical protein COLO4_11875 [Corchorus olitorius]|uniref:FLZ-type domain-containing protein n=1 Tax=Corchorus olitorius TaxID=93759 RepID=A0A1R3K2Y2_9ROSI|nr:hypothetical protein COLO4_11875 [Corchorus olitorius]
MKRSRVNNSPSFGNIHVLNPPPAAASAFRWEPRTTPSIISHYAPPPKGGEMERVGILTVSSPSPQVAVENGQQLQRQELVSDHFLDKCYFCKKGLRQDDARFMYGDFHAFCTPECRTKQIAVDNEKERVSKQSTGTKMECSRKNVLK